ncbi:hypothetical protein MNL04_05535 [Bartonella krasnovii]|uniref:hypothetical protein n=1 Tax=Bartonella krasnovii TaxID=2267275 RepID=UPI001F4C6E48|nr:hypothetical protein [Bartonella krasnovii]UNF48190.1 hypothetical protein MNL04_05535 [Bartonella krasnovii]
MNETFQNLDEKVSEASSAFDTESRVLAFKEAIALSSKDYKIIFCIFVISLAVDSVLQMLNEIIIQVLDEAIIQVLDGVREFDILTFICILILFILICCFLAIPIILILHIRLTKKLKKTLQQLEDTLQQRDKALIVQKRRKK